MVGFFYRFEQEQQAKKNRIYHVIPGLKITPLVTRVFPEKTSFDTQAWITAPSPALFIPFGKRLGYIKKDCTEKYKDGERARATLTAALTSIPAQLLYDIFWSVVYVLIAIPSLIGGIGYAIHAGCTHSYDSSNNAEILFGNVLCAPYFVLSIGIDLCREVLALVTRTYATITESKKGRRQDYWHFDHKQFTDAQEAEMRLEDEQASTKGARIV